MAYDSARGRLVLVGGTIDGGAVSGATVEFDGSTWQNVSTTGISPRRAGHAVAFDESRDVLVLFGGVNEAGSLSASTLEYDGSAWRVVSTPIAPTARKWHAMTYDASRQVVVLYGGQTAAGTASDTWEYNGAAWTARTVTGPGPRLGHSMAFDASTGRCVVFGGLASSNTLATGTWTWNGAAWSNIGGAGDPLRTRGSMTYAPARQRLVLSGGFVPPFHALEVWEFGPGGWQPTGLTGPACVDAALAYFPPLGRAVLAGGSDGSTPRLQTRYLLPGSGLGVEVTPSLQHVGTGQTASFTASVNGSASAWRWLKGGTPLSDDERITGTTTPTLVIQGVAESDGGGYEVVATTSCGPITGGPAMLVVVPACGTADFNGDGDFGTDQDIEAFFACLGGTCCATCFPGGADFNGDGDSGTDQDIESFFRVLGGGAC